MPNEYVAVVITPDAVRDGLLDCILNDLFSVVNMRILWQKYWRISSLDTVVFMYPRLVSKPAFNQIVKTMMVGNCFVVITCGENIYTKLREAKGKIKFNDDYTEVEVTGLRLKYRTWSFRELSQLKDHNCVNRQAILDKIFEYRMHTTDNFKETAILCILCMDDRDIESLKSVAPFLYDEIIRLKSEVA